MPDIDIDFCMNRRGEVIEYVTRKYGRENVAQIITFGTMAAKAAIKDVGRAMDVPYSDVDRIAKMVPDAAEHHAGERALRSRRSSRRRTRKMRRFGSCWKPRRSLKDWCGTRGCMQRGW